MKNSLSVLVVSILFSCFAAPVSMHAQESFQVSIEVNAASEEGDLRRIWRYFGADEPNYAYMKDGRKLLNQLGQLAPDDVYFRTHNLMTSGPGAPALKWGSTNLYSEDVDGNSVYDYRIVDLIFDTYRENKVRPYVQLGFMPKALSTHPEPYQHQWRPGMPYEEVYTGWAYPPKDYEKWSELVYRWVEHCVERYGREEVEAWSGHTETGDRTREQAPEASRGALCGVEPVDGRQPPSRQIASRLRRVPETSSRILESLTVNRLSRERIWPDVLWRSSRSGGSHRRRPQSCSVSTNLVCPIS